MGEGEAGLERAYYHCPDCAKGKIDAVEGRLLSEIELNRPYRLARVLMQEEDRLRYLGALGLYPNASVIVRERAPFDGPLLIEVNGVHHALAHEMAKLLLVTDFSPPSEAHDSEHDLSDEE